MNQDKLKIAFLHRANDPYTLERIKYFSRQNHDVYSISFSIGGYQSKIEGVNVIRLKKYFIDKIPFVKRFSHYFELRKILKKIKPDVLHVVSALNLFYTKTKYCKIKIMENQGSDVIKAPLQHKYLIPYYKHYYKRVDGIIQDSKIAFENGIKYGATNNPELNKIIEIGIDFSIFNKDVPIGVIRGKYNLVNEKIIFHSRAIDELYNIDIIITSILKVRKEFPNCRYILTTSLEKLGTELRKLITLNNLETNILFVGYQDRINSLKYFYRDADVNISVPSSDSSPFSVYESMACMTPNIVTDLPWLYSKFIPGKHLITCPIRDAEILACRISEVLNGKHTIDLDNTFSIVYDQVNLQKENYKLELFYNQLIR